jgi:hypothetical protein
MYSVIAVLAGILLLSGLGKYISVAALSPTADIWEDVLYLAEQGKPCWLRRHSSAPCSCCRHIAVGWNSSPQQSAMLLTSMP